MANLPTVKTPAQTPARKAKEYSTRLINILKDDFQYDVIKDIITTMDYIRRAKKIKPLDKYRLLKDYQLSLLSYCMPKMKVIEDNSADAGGKGVIFNIQIGAPEDNLKKAKGSVSKSKKGVSVSIPTKQQDDGTFVIADD